MITYYVSGDADIEPTGENLRATGRTVLQGESVSADARQALTPGGRFVVVAHGDGDGTVYLRQGVADPQVPWVWVGMNPAPTTTRVYFYCCSVGPTLAAYLERCECLGHCDVVPMPVEEDASDVVSFLDEVDEVIGLESFDSGRSVERLRRFVAEKFEAALANANATNYRSVIVWQMLARSLS